MKDEYEGKTGTRSWCEIYVMLDGRIIHGGTVTETIISWDDFKGFRVVSKEKDRAGIGRGFMKDHELA